MANSLRAQIKKLCHDGKIDAEEQEKLLKKLDGHDAKVRADALAHCEKCEIEQWDAIYHAEEDARAKIVPQAFEWLMQMDIIDCDGCNYPSECVNRNMNCYDVMSEHFAEWLKEKIVKG